MAADPETYYITDHYLNYPWVLVRLGKVHPDAHPTAPNPGVGGPDAMRDLLRGAWRLAASGRGAKGRAKRGG